MVELCERFGTYGLYAVEKSETEFAPELTQRVRCGSQPRA